MLFFASLCLTVVTLTQAISIRRENSLAGPYVAGGENLLFWDFTGSAQLGGSFIRLTTDENDKQGAIWNNFPSISNNWEFQTLFRIHGKGVYLNGDGMALWYVRDTDMLHSGPVFGSKDYFSGLGIFIDTYENQEDLHNHRHPYISGMVNNGSLHYDHDEDGTMTQVGGCHMQIRNLDVPTKIAVSYINNNLAVYIDNEGINQWKLCFKSEKVHLPTGYHFGISASTSEVSDNHDIISVTSLNLDPDDKDWEDRSDIIPEAEIVQIPEKYRKAIEEDLQKMEKKREAREEEEDDEGEEEPDTAEGTTEEEAPPPTSLLRKLIYITGAILVIMISISVFKKYNERRRERMQKRLY